MRPRRYDYWLPGIAAVGGRRAEDEPSRRPVSSGLGIYAAVGKKR